MSISKLSELKARRADAVAATKGLKRRVMICAGTGCVANGSLGVYDELVSAVKKARVPVKIELITHDKKPTKQDPTYIGKSGCHGFCEMGPLVHIMPDDILYCKVKPKDVEELIATTLKKGDIIDRLLYKDPVSKQKKTGSGDIPFYAGQTRVALKNCGHIDPESLDAYLAADGFKALEKALSKMTPTEVIEEVVTSGIRGRGGAGFPTGRKWRTCASIESDERFVICNGDEGDPGAFMDRSIMEGDPFGVLEGLMLAGYAVGARQGYIYVRHEYPLAVERLQKAIDVLHAEGLLGDNILNKGFSFDVSINRGGGAFVCGESTALMRSIEGKIGEPRAKYVRSVVKGLYDKPTVLNNVETLICLPDIVSKGGAAFARTGTKKSSGTKAFSLVGKVKNTGLVEVPMGTTLRQIIYDIGGGIIKDKPFKAVQTGGPSGGCLPASKLDLPVDFDSLTEAGSMMGSGGMIVMDDHTCMVDVARYFIDFLVGESCGKCVPCREGLKQLSWILTRICKGEGRMEDLDLIERLLSLLEGSSLCALGKSAANPVRSTLTYFRDEYLAHIQDKHCRGGVCRDLVTFTITDACTACGICKRNCPVEAISGQKKIKHVIDQDICTRCGACYSVCPFDAITVE